MYTILEKEVLAPAIVRLWIDAPTIARKRRPGQFVIIRIDDHGERVPLTIADADPARGAIAVVVQAVGKSTHELNALPVGRALADVVGPLGQPTRIDPASHVCCIGGGIGAAVVYPIAAGVRATGGTVAAIIGARTRALVILEREMRGVASPCLITTDDGSYGMHGQVTHALATLIEGRASFDKVIAVGPVQMMRAVCDLTRPLGISTIVSLNAIMVDGTGMCGGCRVTVGGESKFVCVDGPEFDGHQVDFGELAARLRAYRQDEERAMSRYLASANR
jgi:ferredoxin--NADP+ reductase